MIKIQNTQEKIFDTTLYSVYKNKNVCHCNFLVLCYILCFVMIHGLRNKKFSKYKIVHEINFKL